MSKWLELVKLIAPIVVGAIAPGGALLGPLVAHSIGEAEALHRATGSYKKDHAMNLVRSGVLGLNAASGRIVLDPAGMESAVSSAIDTTVAVVNLVHQATTPAVPHSSG